MEINFQMLNSNVAGGQSSAPPTPKCRLLMTLKLCSSSAAHSIKLSSVPVFNFVQFLWCETFVHFVNIQTETGSA